MEEKFRLYTGCFNPFGFPNHTRKARNNLRRVLPWMLTKMGKTELASVKGLRVCDACRTKISKLPVGSECDHEANIRDVSPVDEVSPSSSTSRKTIDSENESSELERIEAVTKLNDSLVSLGVSPIAKRKMHQKSYHGKKVKKIHQALSSKVFHVDEERIPEGCDDIIRKLREAYCSTSDRSRKILILTIFEDWPYSKIKKNFDASNHMIKVAKEISSEKGILSTPNQKIGRVLDEGIVLLIKNFYLSDEISRLMPGKKDYISIAGDGERLQIQKRLVLCNIKEAYYHFKEKHMGVKVSFSKFAELRPKNCILAGASGTHSVCVCAIHGNVKLMIDGSKIPILTADSAKPLKTYHDCLAQIICNPPSVECFFRNCSECPGPMHLIHYLQGIFERHMIDKITYKQWVYVDRATLETMQSSIEDFLEKFSNTLEKLLKHSFLSKEQSSYLKYRKENLQSSECLVISDFSENYSFVLQDAIQGVHWNNIQATLHPFVVYYRSDLVIKCKSFVAISESLKHDTIAVHLLQRKLISFLKEEVGEISKIVYFSDGASSQYKNKKNFINLCYHEEDFGITAEWHFFATSHGKGPCDGIGGTLKRLAAKASLQRLDNQISTPNELFLWASENLQSIKVHFFTEKDYAKETMILKNRFATAKQIRGTLNYHSFIPISKLKLHAKLFSFSNNFITESVSK